MTIQIAEFAISRSRDVAWSGQRARLLGSLAALPSKQGSALGKAVELTVRAAISNRGSGTIQFALDVERQPQSLEIVIRRQQATSAGDNHSKGSPGDFHVDNLQTLVDAVVADVDALGSSIRLTVALPTDSEQIAPSQASEWATALATRNVKGALAGSQKRIRDLAGKLVSAKQEGVDLQHELENLRALHETLELLALVASKTDNAVVILDAQCRVEWVNDSFVRMTGFEMPEVRGVLLSTILYGSEQDSAGSQELEAAFSAGHGVSQEILHKRKDGRTYWASVSITPAFDDEGKLSRWIGLASDTTRQRHAQEALRQAKEEAEQASQIKSEFLANMSHEIRTPLNAVIGMAELAIDTDLNDEQREYLTTILDSAENLLGLLNDILDLSKIEARKLDIESLEFSLAEALRDSLKPFAFQARQQGLKLDLDLPLEVPERLIGDPSRLRQIVSNLVGNAIKFTVEGRVTVAVQVKERTSESVSLEFSVKDTGIGIAADKLRQIFDAFTQADTSTTRRFGGTGLGLTISTQLLELMGGSIWVESEEDIGSTFFFQLQLPIGSPVTADARADKFRAAQPEFVDQPMRLLNVLVTDDNRANRRLACKILEKQQHQVREAVGGREVLQLLKSEEFDVILMDVQMPEMDGLETTVAIRQMDELTTQPFIIALTAHAMQGDRERCLAAGMDAYITKPLRSRQLLALVSAVAETPEIAAEASEPSDQAITKFDFSAALGRLEGDRELLVEQMEYYLEDSPILVRDINAALKVADAKKLQMSAHRLRGLSASFDAIELMAITGRLEGCGHEGKLESIRDEPEQLAGAWQQLCEAIGDFLSNGHNRYPS